MALPQGRHHDGNDVEAVKKVFPEMIFSYQDFQIFVGGGDYPNIQPNGFNPPDPLESVFLQDPEDFYLEAQEELDRKPYPTIEGTRTVIKFVAERNPKVASLKAERIVDLSWLKKLDDEGFFEKAYRGK